MPSWSSLSTYVHVCFIVFLQSFTLPIRLSSRWAAVRTDTKINRALPKSWLCFISALLFISAFISGRAVVSLSVNTAGKEDNQLLISPQLTLPKWLHSSSHHEGNLTKEGQNNNPVLTTCIPVKPQKQHVITKGERQIISKALTCSLSK